MSGSQKVPTGYQISPTGQAQADTSYQSILSQLSPYASQALGNLNTAQGLTNNIVNNPYAAGYQGGANTTGAYATGTAAPASYAGAAQMNQMGNLALPYAQQVLDQAFDPQKALYSQQYQQMQDQQNAINSMYGLGSSPYGAGLSGQAAQTFNNNWLNNQMNREATAANIYGTMGNTAGNAYTTGANLANTGMQQYMTGAGLPYTTSTGISGTGLSGLNDLASLYSSFSQPSQSMMSDLAQYLSLGQNATRNAQNAVQANNQASSGFWGGVGDLVGGGFQAITNPMSLFGQKLWG